MQAALRDILAGGSAAPHAGRDARHRRAHRAPAVLLAARRRADGPGLEPEGAGDDDRAHAAGRGMALSHRAVRAGADAPTASSSATSTCAATAIRRFAAATWTRWRPRWSRRGVRSVARRRRRRSAPHRRRRARSPTRTGATTRKRTENDAAPRQAVAARAAGRQPRPDADPRAPRRRAGRAGRGDDHPRRSVVRDPQRRAHEGRAAARASPCAAVGRPDRASRSTSPGRSRRRAAAWCSAGACRTRRCTRRR